VRVNKTRSMARSICLAFADIESEIVFLPELKLENNREGTTLPQKGR
jgi:hypothetical protein